MIVCERCLAAIECHEGNQIQKKIDYFDDVNIVYGYYDDNGEFVEDEYSNEEYVFCEWCNEYEPIEDCYII